MNQRMKFTPGALLCATLLALLIVTPVRAQTTASIHGIITDENKAVVKGARVTATNMLTNESRTTEANEEGYYSLPELALGVYQVRVEMAGFKTAIRQGIELSLNRQAKVDFDLTVGAVGDTLTVVSDAPLVENTTNEMGGLVDQRRIANLPLNGRNTLSLVSLIPGAQQLRPNNLQGFVENKVTINGVREEDSNWLLDGGDNTSPLRNYGNDVPNPDAVQEFRVISNNYSAEYGRTAGAVVNVVTKSGTNEFHASLFEFHRNRALNARNFFQPTKTPLVQNQYGGTFGGPILKDKTFFFGAYQGFKRRTSDFRNSAQAPTAAERSGDFSQSGVVINDPLTGKPFPGNLIPQNRLSQVAVNYLKLAIPLPNTPARGIHALAQTASVPRDNDQFLVKIDHLLSEKHKLSGAYFWSDGSDGQRFLQEIDFAQRVIKSRQQNVNIHEYWTLSTTMLNHFRATYTRSAGNRLVTPDNVTINDLGGKFSPLPTGPIMPPSFNVTGFFNAGSANGGPKIANHYNLADTLSWIKGRHDLKFGAEGFLRKLADISTAPAMGGAFTFDGKKTGYGLADLLLGQVATLTVADQSYKSQSGWSFYGFAQDKFRVTSRLVLDLGVRYELNTWPVHPLDQVIAYIPGRQSNCQPKAPKGILFTCDDGVPRAGVKGDYNDFAPRLGFAYDPFGKGKTVIRGGYGISYAFAIFNALQDQQTSAPFAFSLGAIRNTTLEDPYAPIGGSPFPFRRDAASLIFPASADYTLQDFNTRNGYIQQYNLSVQHQFATDWSVEVAYVGNVGRKLLGQIDLNAPVRSATGTSGNIDNRRPLFPLGIKRLQVAGGFLNSSYNALQSQVNKRFSHGFTLAAAYTFSKTIDQATFYNNRSFWVDQRNLALNKARSGGEAGAPGDRRHLFVVSSVWDLPSFEHSNRLLKSLLGGWAMNTIATFYSGQPVSITTDADNDNDGEPTADRPDLAGDWRLSSSRSRSDVINAWFNADAFRANGANQLGSLGRNVVEGPGLKNIDLGVTRNIRITEKHQLQFRAEAFDLFNWVNLNNPEGRLSRSPRGSDGKFLRNPDGTLQGTFGKITSAADARIFQLGLKYSF